MKLEELRKIIHEEVVKAIREEVRDILTEAVEIASRPQGKPTVHQAAVKKPVIQKEESTSMSFLGDILQETAREMTKTDYRDIMGEPVVVETPGQQLFENVEKPSVVSSEDSLPDFVQRAKAVFDAAVEVDKTRHAV